MFRKAKFETTFQGKKLQTMLQVAKKYKGRIDVHDPIQPSHWGLMKVMTKPQRPPEDPHQRANELREARQKKLSVPPLGLLDRLCDAKPTAFTASSARTTWQKVVKDTEYESSRATTMRDAQEARNRVRHIRQEVAHRAAEAKARDEAEHKGSRVGFQYGSKVQVSLMCKQRPTGQWVSAIVVGTGCGDVYDVQTADGRIKHQLPASFLRRPSKKPARARSRRLSVTSPSHYHISSVMQQLPPVTWRDYSEPASGLTPRAAALHQELSKQLHMNGLWQMSRRTPRKTQRIAPPISSRRPPWRPQDCTTHITSKQPSTQRLLRPTPPSDRPNRRKMDTNAKNKTNDRRVNVYSTATIVSNIEL